MSKSKRKYEIIAHALISVICTKPIAVKYNTQDFVKGEYFLEPTKVYSNIKNGYGVWGAYNLSTAEIKW
jgi:hypothetical protein